MLDQKTRDSLTQSELVSHHLRSLALLADPGQGRLSKLAEAMGAHPVTLSNWIAQGYVPLKQCERLIELYGKKKVLLDDLCPEQFRY